MPPMDTNMGMPQGDMGSSMPPMDDNMGMPDQQDGGGNSEIEGIFSQLTPEKQKAVLKYAESMAEEDEPSSGPMSQTENYGVDGDLVVEITNDVLDDRKDKKKDKEDKKIGNEKVSRESVFRSKF